MVGNQETVSDFLHLLRAYEILDISRSGVIAVDRESAKENAEE